MFEATPRVSEPPIMILVCGVNRFPVVDLKVSRRGSDDVAFQVRNRPGTRRATSWICTVFYVVYEKSL